MNDTQIKPATRATRYEVSCLPEDHETQPSMTISIEYRGGDRWAVTNRGRFLGSDGAWSHPYGWDREPTTEEEMDAYEVGREAWLTAHRFDLDTARQLAQEAAPKLTVNRYTVTDLLNWPSEQ